MFFDDPPPVWALPELYKRHGWLNWFDHCCWEPHTGLMGKMEQNQHYIDGSLSVKTHRMPSKKVSLSSPPSRRNDNFVFNGLLWEQNVMKRRGVIRFYTQHNMATDSTEKWNLDPVTHGISLIEQLTTNVCESARKDSGKRLRAQPALNHTFMHPPFPKEIFHP